jgi:hypothetical protein
VEWFKVEPEFKPQYRKKKKKKKKTGRRGYLNTSIEILG